MQKFIGTIVKNDGKELGEVLGLEKWYHLGNYIFSGRLKDNTVVNVYAEPVGYDELIIKEIK